ncbi:MAG: ATP phosphoribosyltransferase [Parcubacteria group bacterium]|nr:ATP phosphoribosyltransferase [Parcubacteria group bacterium]
MRIAIPKGRLYDSIMDVLEKSGLFVQTMSSRSYALEMKDSGLSGRIVKVRAIPQLIALGNFDVGFCGLDLVKEADYENVVSLLDLGLNPVELVVAVHASQTDILKNPPKRPLLIATEYENIAHAWALAHNLAHITIQTYGSTEGYAPQDADIVFDCSETGTTLEANGLVVVERLMKSTTYLVANNDSLRARHQEIIDFVERLKLRKEVSI